MLFLNEGHRQFREVGVAGGARPGAVRPQPRRRRSPTSTATGGPTSTSRTTRIRTGSTSTSPAARSASTSSTRARCEASPTRTPAWASPPPTTTATAGPTSSSRTRAGRRTRSTRARSARCSPTSRTPFTSALGTTCTGWGDSWVDLDNDGKLDLVLANGAIPVTNLAKDAAPAAGVVAQRRTARSSTPASCRGIARQRARPRGRRLRQRRPRRRRGQHDRRQARPAPQHRARSRHWLEVQREAVLARALVTVVGRDGRGSVREVQAGGELPLVRGSARALRPRRGRHAGVALIVRYPDGTRQAARATCGVDRVVTVNALAAGLRLPAARERVERDGEEQDAAGRDEDRRRAENPKMKRPFAIVAITAAPSTALRTSPRPPKRLVPPITAAEIASSSSVPPPWSGATERRFAGEDDAADAGHAARRS